MKLEPEDYIVKYREIRTWIQDNMSEGVYPSDKEVNDWLNGYVRIVKGSISNFMFCYNIVDQKIFSIHNYGRIIGYPDETLTMEQHILNVCDPERETYFLNGIRIWEILKNIIDSKYKILPFKFQYSIKIPLKTASGKTFEILQHSYPIQFDKNGYMVKYMNFYTKIREYTEKDIRSGKIDCEIRDYNARRIKKMEELLKERKDFELTQPYTPRQKQILQVIASSNYSISIVKLANKIGVRRDTVNDHIYKGNNCIFAKAEEHSGRRFINVYEIAKYYRNLDII